MAYKPEIPGSTQSFHYRKGQRCYIIPEYGKHPAKNETREEKDKTTEHDTLEFLIK